MGSNHQLREFSFEIYIFAIICLRKLVTSSNEVIKQTSLSSLPPELTDNTRNGCLVCLDTPVSLAKALQRTM